MKRKYTGPDKEHLAGLDLMVTAQRLWLEQVSTVLESTLRRVYALQGLLVERGTVTWEAVEARSQFIDLDTIGEVELSPKYEEFRRRRDAVRRLQEEEGESP